MSITIDGDAVVRYGDGKPLPKPDGWEDRYNPAQPRRPDGKWGSGGFGGGLGEIGADEQKAAVGAWQSDFATCRAIQENPDSPTGRAFAAAVAASPRVDGAVYRGVNEHAAGRELTAAESKAQWTGRVGSDVAFDNLVSASPDLDTATRFGDTVFEVFGSEAHDISGMSRFPDFKEAIVGAGTYRVASVREGPSISQTLFGPISPRPSTIVTLFDTRSLP